MRYGTCIALSRRYWHPNVRNETKALSVWSRESREKELCTTRSRSYPWSICINVKGIDGVKWWVSARAVYPSELWWRQLHILWSLPHCCSTSVILVTVMIEILGVNVHRAIYLTSYRNYLCNILSIWWVRRLFYIISRWRIKKKHRVHHRVFDI